MTTDLPESGCLELAVEESVAGTSGAAERRRLILQSDLTLSGPTERARHNAVAFYLRNSTERRRERSFGGGADTNTLDARLEALYAADDFGAEKTTLARVIRELIDEIRLLRHELSKSERSGPAASGPGKAAHDVIRPDKRCGQRVGSSSDEVRTYRLTVESTWETRELVILRAVRGAEEADGDPNAAARAAVRDLRDNVYTETINSLTAAGFLAANVTSMGNGRLMVHIQRLLPEGRRAIGQWPRPSAADVDDKRSRRLVFMDALYDGAEDSTLEPVSVDEIAAKFGWDAGEVQRIVVYLENEGLLNFEMGNQATITHQGIVEVEQSRSKPDAPTQHFPPSTVVYIAGDVTNSQFQAGVTGSVQIRTDDSERLEAVRHFISEFRRALPDLPDGLGDPATIAANLDAAEALLGAPEPNASALGALLTALRDIALSATGSAAFFGVVNAARAIF